jgi:predicted RNase H-like nuclease
MLLPPRSSTVSTYVGVDGCPAGWFAVEYGTEGFDARLCPDFTTVVDAFGDADRLLVDIPIGLPDESRRACDVAARERLGSRASTVFFAPCRGVLDAGSHEEASAVNRTRTGYGLSIQAWHLVARIREVDRAVRSSLAARDRVSEAHPELCFAALGAGPVEASKSTEAGRQERLDRLRRLHPEASDLYHASLDEFRRAAVRRDDVLDALVLAVSAAQRLTRVPDCTDDAVPRDAVGLPMEIRFPRAEDVSLRKSRQTPG